MKLASIALTVGAALAMAACSENSGDTVRPTVAGADGGSGPVGLEARDFSFVPNHLSASSDEISIVFQNSGAVPHSLAFYTDAGHENAVRDAGAGEVRPGASADVTFRSPEAVATLYFRCEVHPDRMRGELAVTPGG
jgi:hypothetical protein